MAKNLKRNAILLLGMHRSGTSAATRIFNLLGYDLPKSLMGVNESNPVGHWESDAVVVLNDVLLKELGSSWYSWQYFTTDTFSIERKKDIIADIGRHLRLEFPGKKDFILKDPRISRLANLYLEAFEENDIIPNVVMSIRNPLSVAESLGKRDDMFKGDAALLWLRYVLDAEYSSRGHNRAFFSYEALLSDSQTTLEQVSQSLSMDFPLSPESIAPQISSFLDEGMQHHAKTAEDLVFDPVMRGWIDRAYSLLMGLCAQPNDADIMDALDAIRDELNHVAPVMDNLRKEAELRESSQLEQLKIAKDVNDNLGLKVEEYVNRTTLLIETNQANEAELNTYKNDLELADRMKSELSARIEDLIKSSTRRGLVSRSENTKLREKLEQSSGEALQLSKTLEQKGQELSQRLEEEKRLREELDETAKDVSRLEKELQDSLEKSKSDVADLEKELQASLEKYKSDVAELEKEIEKKQDTEKSLMAQLRERVDAESILNSKVHKLEAAERQANKKIEVLEKDYNNLKLGKAQEIDKLKSEGADLLARNFDLAHDVQTLKDELQKEKRSVFRPALRRGRSLTGKVLRAVLPASAVDKLASKIPPREKPVGLIAFAPNPALPPKKSVPNEPGNTQTDEKA